MISGWNHDGDGLTVDLLITPRRGFTGKLTHRRNYPVSAIIDGPYGGHDFSQYGTVMMFATGIGVANHLSYIKELVQGYNRCEVKTRHIILVWRPEKDGDQIWAKSLMDKLLLDDITAYAIEVYIYVHDAKMEKRVKPDGRITTIMGEPNIENILNKAFRSLKGEMVISISTDVQMSDDIRDTVSRNLPKGVRLVELEFQPSSRMRARRLPSQLDFHCTGIA
ncbi:MAG: hypothetical protein M1840_006349 [Geoglossum simile]|nr:MAG: hypothetical protein M1840_006349 [Geoglossum simile]